MTTVASAAATTSAVPGRAVEALLLCAILAAAVVVQLRGETNTDVSWAFTLGERWLAGERPYVDFIEVNPPATLLLYMPVVLIARWLGALPEHVLAPMVLLAILCSVRTTARLLQRASLVPAVARTPFAVAAVALLALMPLGDFGEREHLAVIAVLPLLAMLAGRLAGKAAPVGLSVAVGAVAGLALAVKPMFVLAILGPMLPLARRRGWRALFSCPELIAAAVVPGVYGLAVPLVFPAFTSDILHTVLVAYVPLRQPLWNILFQPAVVAGAGLALLAWLGRPTRGGAEWLDVLLLAAAGFFGAYILQGKTWAYQALPAVTLAGLAACDSVTVCGAPSRRLIGRGLASAASLVLACSAALAFDTHPTMGAAIPGLKEAIVAVAPHPRMLALTGDIALGHPLVRDVGGSWVGSYPCEWITGNTDKLETRGVPASTATELDALSRAEEIRVADDIATRKPDVILVQNGRWQHYGEGVAGVRDALARYEPVGSFGAVTLWVRRDRPNRGGADALR